MTATARLLIAGGRVLGQGADPHLPAIADLRIDGGRVAAIGRGLEAEGARVIDARGKLVIPGFVNAHYHSHDVFLKGYFEPQPLEQWVLNALPRNYPPRSPAGCWPGSRTLSSAGRMPANCSRLPVLAAALTRSAR